jgi:hypothetical protein
MTFRFYRSARYNMSSNFSVLRTMGWSVQWATWSWCSYSCSHPDNLRLSYVEQVYTLSPFFHWEWDGVNFLDGSGFIDERYFEKYVLPFVPCEQGRLFRDTFEDEFSHLDVKGKRRVRRVRRD